MACLKCAHLEQLFESKLSKYGEARSAMFHQVSTDLAAKKQVDMERARYDLEEHQLLCSDESIGIFQSTRCDFAATFPPASTLVMTVDSDQAVALIKELLVLNRTESVFELAGSTVKQVEERRAIRKRLRQELVRVLHLRDRRNP